jgi:hypothetical protein
LAGVERWIGRHDLNESRRCEDPFKLPLAIQLPLGVVRPPASQLSMRVLSDRTGEDLQNHVPEFRLRILAIDFAH